MSICEMARCRLVHLGSDHWSFAVTSMSLIIIPKFGTTAFMAWTQLHVFVILAQACAKVGDSSIGTGHIHHVLESLHMNHHATFHNLIWKQLPTNAPKFRTVVTSMVIIKWFWLLLCQIAFVRAWTRCL